MNIIYESLPTLPPLAASILICCIYIMLAGLAIWLAANAGMKLVGMIMEAIEADKALALIQREQDADEVNFWIHENFTNKRKASQTHDEDQKAIEAERRRADLAEHKYRQLLKGQQYLESMEGGKA